MTIVRKSNEAIRAAKGRIDIEKVDSATEEDIERWKREDGIDDGALGPPRYVRVDPDVRLVRERLGLSQEEIFGLFRLKCPTAPVTAAG